MQPLLSVSLYDLGTHQLFKTKHLHVKANKSEDLTGFSRLKIKKSSALVFLTTLFFSDKLRDKGYPFSAICEDYASLCQKLNLSFTQLQISNCKCLD